jgi:DNA repair exonuclease SbcCD nuclease subunit
MFKFIHAADIHLDSPLHRLEAYEGAPVAEIRQASRRAFENLIDLAVTESVDVVLIAGDLFDGDWKDYHTGLYFITQIHRLKAAGIAVLVVSGNHDAAGRMTRSLPYPDNVHVFSARSPETRKLDALRIAVHGQSFAAATVKDNLALGYPEPVSGYFNIGLLHTSLTGRDGHETYAPCTLADLQSRGYDYWALGHVHQFEIAAVNPPVVFPGCLQGRHARETGPKGALLVTVAEDSPPKIIHHPLDVIRWIQLAVHLEGAPTEQACLDRFVDALEEQIQRNAPVPLIIRVSLTGKTAAHEQMAGDLEYVKEACRSAAIAHFGDRVWIDTVTVATQPPRRAGQAPIDPGPLRELERLAAEIQADDDLLQLLGEDLTDLFRKLPADYRQGPGAIDPANPAHLRHIVNQAYAMLARGLKRERYEA